VGSHIDKLREREDDGGKHQFILTLDITTVKWELSGWNEAMTRSLEERISIRLRTSVHQ